MAYPLYVEELLAKWSRNEITDSELAVNSGIEDAAELEALKQQHLNAVKAIKYFALRQAVAQVHAEYTTPAKASTPAKVIRLHPGKWARIGIAAALLIGLFAIQQMVWVSNSSMYNQMFQPYQLTVERDIEAQPGNNMVEAFRQGDYKSVIQQYEKEAVNGAREQFFTGYAYLQMQQPQKAADLFKMVLANKSQQGLYQDEAGFYLALALLKSGDKNGAADILEDISKQPEHSYHEAVSSWDINRIRWSY